MQRQLQTATQTIEETGTHTRATERKLRSIEQLVPAESATILKSLGGFPAIDSAEEGDSDDASQGQMRCVRDYNREQSVSYLCSNSKARTIGFNS